MLTRPLLEHYLFNTVLIFIRYRLIPGLWPPVKNKVSRKRPVSCDIHGFLRYPAFAGRNTGNLFCCLRPIMPTTGLETLLMNFFKFTGLNGLQGIAANTSFDYPTGKLEVRRPLLFAAKDDICHLLRKRASHTGRFFQPVRRLYRNFFRHQLIPAIRGVFPKWSKTCWTI